jgi:hypothetical protein
MDTLSADEVMTEAKHAAIRQANAALLSATLERAFSSTTQGAIHGQ